MTEPTELMAAAACHVVTPLLFLHTTPFFFEERAKTTLLIYL